MASTTEGWPPSHRPPAAVDPPPVVPGGMGDAEAPAEPTHRNGGLYPDLLEDLVAG